MTMDAATRAELAALRRRAYGPDADIAHDSAEMTRLVELEELALPVVSEAAGDPVDPFDRPGLTTDEPARDLSSPRRRVIVGLVASVAVLAAAVSTVVGLQTVPDAIPVGAATPSWTIRPTETDAIANGPVAIPLLIDSVRGTFIDVSSRRDTPVFRANSLTTWAQPLGVRYGWRVWVAAVTSEQGIEKCLLLAKGTSTRTRCVPQEGTADGALAVSLGYGEFADFERPLGMAPDQQLTFAWGGGAYITIEITG